MDSYTRLQAQAQISPQPRKQSVWQSIGNYLQGNPQAQALVPQGVEGSPAIDQGRPMLNPNAVQGFERSFKGIR